jgi:hypothetical protein
MRVDRRVSPNQTALWTVYELVNAQTVQTPAAPRPVHRRSRAWVVDLWNALVEFVHTAWQGELRDSYGSNVRDLTWWGRTTVKWR